MESLKSNSIDYRIDIDILRAFSIVSVLLYHFEFQFAQGGFLGVDIFFVISGYLITSIIRNSELTIDFLKKFFTARSKRIFPAYFFVLIIVFIFGNFSFNSELVERLNGSIIYAIFFISNLFFAQEGGYFAISNNLKPLLHFWSLSVEIHYYILWTLISLIILTTIKKFYSIFIVIVFLFSLIFSQYVIDIGKLNSVFLLTPFRVFEFCVGAILSYKFLIIRNIFFSSIAQIIGWFILFFSVFNFFNHNINHPSLITLLPLSGVFLILVSKNKFINSKNIFNNFLVFIGKISYSLYLVHWPIIVFFKYHTSAELTPLNKLLLIISCFIFSFLLFKFIEVPFRKKTYSKLKKTISVFSLFFIIIIIFISSVIWAKGEMFWRYKIIKYDIDEINRANDHFKDMNIIGEFRSLKNFNQNSEYKILLLGDSHMEDIGSSLMLYTKNNKNFSFVGMPFDDMCFANHDTRDSIFLRYFDKMGQECDIKRKSIFSSSQFKQATHIILVNHWEEYTVNLLTTAKKTLNGESSAKIIIIGQTPIFDSFDNFFYDKISLDEKDFNNFLFNTKKMEWTIINKELAELSKELNLPYINRYDHICDIQTKSCKVLFNKNFTYKDRGHWSYFGKEFFSEYLFRELKNNL